MVTFVIKKLVYMLLVILGVTILSFVLANIAPVDPAEAYAKRINLSVSEETIEQTREEFGFDKSIPEQYGEWVGKIIHLDFGNSYSSKQPVLNEIAAVLPQTLLLSLLATGFIIVFSVPLALLSVRYEGTWVDKVISIFSFASISVPVYFVGLIVLLLFGMKLGWFPIIGHGNPISMIFASLVLAFPMVGSLIRIIRSLILENKEKDFILYARARGLSEKTILRRHLLLNAAPSCITMFGQNIGYLIAGTAVMETIFSTHGLGQYALNAALNRDFPAINGYIVIMAVFFVVCNLTAEIISIRLNPQLERGDII